MKHFRFLSEMHKASGMPMPEQPLLSLIGCVETCGLTDDEFTTDFFIIGLKKVVSGSFYYGRTKFDHNGGSMTYVKPGQVIELKNIKLEGDGFSIMIHQDYLSGQRLHQLIKKYSFFDYETNEALHISPREEEIMWELFRKIETEYYNNQDEYSKEIIIGISNRSSNIPNVSIKDNSSTGVNYQERSSLSLTQRCSNILKTAHCRRMDCRRLPLLLHS